MDTTPPTIISTAPTQGATGVSRYQGVTITFSEDMDASSISGTTITTTPGMLVSYNAALHRAELSNPSTIWPSLTTVTVHVSTGVRDVAGNALTAAYDLTFTTEDNDAPTVLSVSPLNGATSVLPDSGVQVVFSEDLAPSTVTAANFTIDGVDAGVTWNQPTHTATFVTNTLPLGVLTARVHTGVTDLAGNALASEYAWSFTVSPGDTTPPAITSISPTNGQINVPLNAQMTVTFSEDLDQSTVTSANLYASVPTTLTYDAPTRTATLTPISNMPQMTIITRTVTSGIKDLAGNALAGTTFSFTTKDPGPPYLVSSTPANGDTNTSRTMTLTLNFNEVIDSTTIAAGITCDVAFTRSSSGNVIYLYAPSPSYQWPNATTIHCHVNAALKDLDGLSATPADITFTTADTVGPFVISRTPAANATGVPINSPIRITFDDDINQSTLTTTSFYVNGRTGTVTYDAPTRTATWTDSQPFAFSTVYSVRVTNGLKDLVGNSAITTSTNFTTEPDTYPPTVLSSVPANNATGVLQTLGSMRVNFSEAMSAATITAANFTCTKKIGSGSPVSQPGTVTYSASAMAALFVPSTPFDYLAVYSCTVSTAVTDAAGNALGAPYTFSFTVESDTYPPKIASSSPGRYAHFVPLTGAVTVTFDETVQSATVNATNVKINGVTSTVSYNSSTLTATLTPSTSLVADTTYVISVNGVKDTAGHTITTPVTVEFRTVPTTVQISGVTRPQYLEAKAVEMTGGTLHLTRVSNGNNTARLQWAYLANASSTWTSGDLGVADTVSGTQLLATAWGTNQAAVAWKDPQNPGMYLFASFDGTNWTATAQMPSASNMVLAGGDKVGLLRSDTSSSGIFVQFFDGTSWGTATQIATQGTPNSLAYNGAEWCAVWRYATGTIGNWYVYAATLSGSTWTTIQLMNFTRPSTSAPAWAIASNPTGFAVAFVDRGEGYAAVRYNGAWQAAVTNGYTGGRNDWFQLASNGTGYAWLYSVGASAVAGLRYRIWDGATQTWSNQPTDGIPYTAYLGDGRSMALTSSGSDYFVVQEVDVSGLRLHRYSGGAWTTTTLTTTAAAPVGGITGAGGRASALWTVGTQLWSATYDSGWGAAQQLDSGGAGGALPALSRSGTTLRAMFVDDEVLRTRTTATGTTFAAASDIANVGLNGPASIPAIALADDGRALAVWSQYESGLPRIFARYFDGHAWAAQPFRVTKTWAQPQVATNGTRWVITWRELTGSSNVMATSWTLAGGLTAPTQLVTSTYNFATASSSGTFLVAVYASSTSLYTRFSADGLTWDAAQVPDSNFSNPLALVAAPGVYAVSGTFFGSSTTVRERGVTSASTWSSSTSHSSNRCTLAALETTYGGICTSTTGGPVMGFVNTQPETQLASSFTGTGLAVGGEGDRLRAVWNTTSRDFDPLHDWAAPLTLPTAMTALADDSVHFFGMAPGSGGNGVTIYEEDVAAGFGTPHVLEATTPPETPALGRGRGEVGVVWEKADTIWGTVF